VEQALLSDITNDGTCDFEDFAHFAAIFADEGEQLYGDFDRDGTAGFGDLGWIRDDWLRETNWHK
jgi:hypothetical protein